MTHHGRSPRPRWFTIAAVALVGWGLIGCFAWVQQVRFGASAMGPPSRYDLALYESLPAWYNGCYGVAVGASLLAALALLGRSRLARPLAAVSLAAVVVQFGWLFGATDIVAAKGAGQVLPFPVLIVAVAVAQFVLAGRAGRSRRTF